MSVTSAPERQFVTFQRGEQRDQMLTSFRISLRQQIDPETFLPYAEEQIATATSRQSKWYTEADAIDLVLQAGEQRARYMADQARIDRAATPFLSNYHLRMWGEDYLPATGGSGKTTASAPAGTTFIGSTTIPDPIAHFATDEAGLRYQVLFSVTTPSNGIAGSDSAEPLILVGIDTGSATNLAPGKKLRWSNPPANVVEQITVTEQFVGGLERETDADVAKRLMSRIRNKPASGNNAHFRAWARESSNAIEDALIFACAHEAGSTHVCILQKRVVSGPLGRIASIATLTAATAYLTPPSSPVVPGNPHVVVTTATPVSSHAIMSLSLPRGRSSGWEDRSPWPAQNAGTGALISVVTDQTHFRMTTTLALPTGVTQPSIMVWNDATSRFVKLLVTSVTSAGGNNYDVVLLAPCSKTLAVGDVISPYSRRLVLIAEAIEAYFDSLGPSELIDLATDLRAHRAFRWPEPNEELPQRAGDAVLSMLRNSMGVALADSKLESMSVNVPPLPSDPVDGPRLIVAGRMGIYPL